MAMKWKTDTVHLPYNTPVLLAILNRTGEFKAPQGPGTMVYLVARFRDGHFFIDGADVPCDSHISGWTHIPPFEVE